MVTILLGLSNSADPFFSDRNLENSGPSSGSIRNFFSIFFNRLEVSQIFFQSAARPIGHNKNGISVFLDSGWPQGPVLPYVGLTKGTDSKRLIYLRGFTYILRSAQQLK